jgi:hypothetical protein
MKTIDADDTSILLVNLADEFYATGTTSTRTWVARSPSMFKGDIV